MVHTDKSSKIKTQAFFCIFLTLFFISGCADYMSRRKPPKADVAGLEPGRTVDNSTQTVCDVDRSRARAELLKRLSIDSFREVALKISREVTFEEISELKQLGLSQRSGVETPWEMERRRSDLIKEIYTGAIIRAGFKPSSTELIHSGPLSYTVGVNSLGSGRDSYVIFVLGTFSKESNPEGGISQVLIGARPDQVRYYVGLNRFSRFETQPDNSKTPIYTTLSLFEAIEDTLPYYCHKADSALDLEEFNTVEGLSFRRGFGF